MKGATQKTALHEILCLNLSEDQMYESYFERDFWTITEFAALMAGISPEKFDEIVKKKPGNAQDFKYFSSVIETQQQVLSAIKSTLPLRHFVILNKSIALSPWRFIKWMAGNRIPMLKRFFRELPVYLMELYEEFQPLNNTLRTCPPWHRAFHRAQYLKHVEK